MKIVTACAVIATAAVLVLPSVAAASSPSCASAPAPYSGSDAATAAITQLDADVDANCAAIAARIDGLESDVTAAASQAHGDSGQLDGDLSTLNATVSGWTSSTPLAVTLPGGGGGQAVDVTNWPADQTVTPDASSASATDGQAEALHGDLWVLVGVVLGCALMQIVIGKLWP